MATDRDRPCLVREMRPEDYDRLVDLWREAGLPYRPEGRDSRQNIAREISSGHADFLVAESGGNMTGSILCTNDGRKLWINRLAVLPSWQRRGVAGMLLEEAERCAERRGLAVIACLIHAENEPSRELFAKKGYTVDPDILYYSKRKGPMA
jgi:ribosomal protein S18 acetylase RimI-like enzyme